MLAAEDVLVCDICNGAIVWRCQQCSQWLCDDCQVRHNKTSSTKRHHTESVFGIAKQQRLVLEKQYDILKRSDERLVKTLQRLEFEADTILAQKSHVLQDSSELRTEWIEKVNQHFDAIDDKVTFFATERLNDLEKVQKRINSVHQELNDKSTDLRQFLMQSEPILISRGNAKSKKIGGFIKEVTIPKVDFRKTAMTLTRGLRWDNRAAATLDLQGSQAIGSVPLVGAAEMFAS